LGYDEVVGTHNLGRYIMDDQGPLPGQYMILFDSNGRFTGSMNFLGMRSWGDRVP
jgi:hypothetical protein